MYSYLSKQGVTKTYGQRQNETKVPKIRDFFSINFLQDLMPIVLATGDTERQGSVDSDPAANPMLNNY